MLNLSLIPSAVLGLRGWRSIVELRQEPLQAVEVVEQAAFGVFVGVIEDSDGTAVTAGTDDAQDLDVLRADAERENFATLRFAVDVHAIEVETEQMRQHARQNFGESVEMTVTVMQVVNDADVLNALSLQSRADSNHVFRLATPAAVIVDADLTIERRRGLANGFETGDLFFDAAFLIGLVLHLDGTATTADPELRVHIVALEEIKSLPGLVIDRSGKPPAHQLDVMLLERGQFIIPLRDMLGAVIIDELLHAHLFQHGRTLLRPAFLRVKRHDAPRGEVGFVEEIGTDDGDREAEEGNEAVEHKGAWGGSVLPQRGKGAEVQSAKNSASLSLCSSAAIRAVETCHRS